MRLALLLAALIAAAPSIARACNLRSELEAIAFMTAELHLKVSMQHHDEMSKIIATRMMAIRDADAAGLDDAACDRAETLKAWIQREEAGDAERTSR